ncbi:hypothetical protein BGZ58_004712 [Dissophora ornata]|nr:hypothetical protein BGZ58_004712 [Dissophora ornata]
MANASDMQRSSLASRTNSCPELVAGEHIVIRSQVQYIHKDVYRKRREEAATGNGTLQKEAPHKPEDFIQAPTGNNTRTTTSAAAAVVSSDTTTLSLENRGLSHDLMVTQDIQLLINDVQSSLHTLPVNDHQQLLQTLIARMDNLPNASVANMTTIATSTLSRNGTISTNISQTVADSDHPNDQTALLRQVLQQANMIKDDVHTGFTRVTVLLLVVIELAKENRVLLEKVNDVQAQMLKKLADIKSGIEAVLTQNFELHEYTTPRLFIVLPKATGSRDVVGRLCSDSFRLYFLCECGEHTQTEGGPKHSIHFAKHEGYELQKPNDFFEKHGARTLRMLQMIKYGVCVAGFFLPALSQSGVLGGFEKVEKYLDKSWGSFAGMVDATMTFIEKNGGDTTGGIDKVSRHTNLDEVEGWTGPDLRKLEAYLATYDKDKVFGNLRKITTKKGHVRWVCKDHQLGGSRRESDLQDLREFVREKGTFDEERGKVVITIASKGQAKLFYKAVIKANCIQELDIALAWDVTRKHLKKLAMGVRDANIVCLTIDGACFKGPISDFLNGGKRFDPIFQMTSNGRIQSLHLRNFVKFYPRTSDSALDTAPNIRYLTIESMLPSKEKATRYIVKSIFDCFESLITLDLKSSHWTPILDDLMEKLEGLQRLQAMTIDYDERRLTMDFSKGKLIAVTIRAIRLKDLSPDDPFLKKYNIHQLHVDRTPDRAEEKQLRDILHNKMELFEVRIGCRPERALVLIDFITSTRLDVLAKYRKSELRKVDLANDEEHPIGDTASKDVLNVTIDFPNLGNNDFGVNIHLEMRDTAPVDESSPLSGIFEKYAWSIEKLAANQAFSDHLAALLDSKTEDKGSKLTSLMLIPSSLTPTGLECMVRVIGRSKGLERLGFTLQKLHDEDRRMAAARILDPHKGIISSLLLEGSAADSWIPEIEAACSCRSDVRNLDTFKLVCSDSQDVWQDNQELSLDRAQWIAAMVSSPPVLSPILPAFESILELPQAWRSLQEIQLHFLRLSPQGWSAVIEAIDLSALETLSLDDTNFSLEQLQLLIKRIPEPNTSAVPLKVVSLFNTDLDKCCEPRAMKEAYVWFREKTPRTKIEGLKL